MMAHNDPRERLVKLGSEALDAIYEYELGHEEFHEVKDKFMATDHGTEEHNDMASVLSIAALAMVKLSADRKAAVAEYVTTRRTIEDMEESVDTASSLDKLFGDVKADLDKLGVVNPDGHE